MPIWLEAVLAAAALMFAVGVSAAALAVILVDRAMRIVSDDVDALTLRVARLEDDIERVERTIGRHIPKGPMRDDAIPRRLRRPTGNPGAEGVISRRNKGREA